MKKSKGSKGYIFYISIFIMIVIWQVLAMILDYEIILPSPKSTLLRLIDMILNEPHIYFKAVLHTITRGLVAVIIIIILGVIFGLIMGVNKNVYSFLIPYVKFLQATPVVSWIILAIVWIDDYNLIPIFVMILTILPVMIINVIEGVKEIDPKILEMARLYELSTLSKIKIYIGSTIPYILAGSTIVVGQAWKVSAVAELLSNPDFGIGVSMNMSMLNIANVDTFVWTATIIIISGLFNALLGILRKKVELWKN